MTDKLVLYRPIMPIKVNQYLGEDRLCVESSTRRTYLTPVDGTTCPAGFESYYRSVGLLGHDGTDFGAYSGQPIYSACAGTVNELQTVVERGLGIGIISDVMHHFVHGPYCEDEGDYFANTRYWHLKSFNVKQGDKVNAGQLIGWADNTGYTSGDHLHFELKPMHQNPDGTFAPVFPSNGLNGSIDPTDYFSDLSAFELNSFLTRLRYLLADQLNRSKLTG